MLLWLIIFDILTPLMQIDYLLYKFTKFIIIRFTKQLRNIKYTLFNKLFILIKNLKTNRYVSNSYVSLIPIYLLLKTKWLFILL